MSYLFRRVQCTEEIKTVSPLLEFIGVAGEVCYFWAVSLIHVFTSAYLHTVARWRKPSKMLRSNLIGGGFHDSCSMQCTTHTSSHLCICTFWTDSWACTRHEDYEFLYLFALASPWFLYLMLPFCFVIILFFKVAILLSHFET